MQGAYALAGLLAVTLLTSSVVYGVAIWRNDASGLTPALRAAFGHGLILTFVLTVIFTFVQALRAPKHP